MITLGTKQHMDLRCILQMKGTSLEALYMHGGMCMIFWVRQNVGRESVTAKD